jgi:hypothetical protein
MDKETTTVRQCFNRKGENPMISTRKHVSKLMGLVLGCSVMIATPSYAVPYSWVDWTAANATSASGTVDAVPVTFAGNLAPAAQTSGGPIDYWATNPSIYTSAGVDNGPTPNSDIIRLTGGAGTGPQTLTFITPVVNPVMAILSLGNPELLTKYEFNSPFTILNQGTGYWGGTGTSLTTLGNTLQGTEGHGIIQFSGTFDSTTPIIWTMPISENWHGFTVGIANVPEPASLMLLGAGLAGIGIWRRKATKAEKGV